MTEIEQWTAVARKNSNDRPGPLATPCWIWTRGKVRGYAVVRADYRQAKLCRLLLGLITGGPLIARHRCDVTDCVNPEHLLRGTWADNMRDKVERGRQAKGEGFRRTKITVNVVHEIRRLAALGLSTRAIAREIGSVLSPGPIWQIINGKTWKHVPTKGASS